MNDRQLEAFVAIANASSINGAARDLLVSQQTLSYQLTSLEGELGYPLFTRTRAGVVLTPKGALFKRDAEQILSIVKRACARSSEPTAPEVLRISLRSDAGPMILLEICERFAVEHPEVEMRLLSTPVAHQYRDLRQGLFDVTEYPDSDLFHEHGLGFAKIAESPNYCLVRKQSPLASKDHIALEDLADQHVCIVGKGSCRGADRLRSLIAEKYPEIIIADIDYNAAQITIGSLQDMVVIAPKVFTDHNVNPAAQIAVPLDTGIAISVGLVYAGSTPLPVVQKFIETARRVRFS